MKNISDIEKMEFIKKFSFPPNPKVAIFIEEMDISDFDKNILLQINEICYPEKTEYPRKVYFKTIPFFPYFYFDNEKYYYLGFWGEFYYIVGKVIENQNMEIYCTTESLNKGLFNENNPIFRYFNNNLSNFLYFTIVLNKCDNYCFETIKRHGKGELTQKQANDIIIQQYKDIQETFRSCDEWAMSYDNYWGNIIGYFGTGGYGDYLEEIPFKPEDDPNNNQFEPEDDPASSNQAEDFISDIPKQNNNIDDLPF